MGCSYTNVLPILLLIFFFFSSVPTSLAVHKALNHSVSAIFVFGDSTVDPGNNNYINTIFKSDFPPYGQNFPNHIATGRFSNGKLVTDFISSYLGIKDFIPPYLDMTLSLEELMTGVSFASAGSGYDPLTPQITEVIPVQKQLEYFKEYKTRLQLIMGKERMESHVNKAIYIISAGTNDFVVNYFTLPVRKIKYSLADYQAFLLQNTRDFVQGLLDQGARRIGIAGVPPMGCLPAVITFSSDNAVLQRGCIDSYNEVAKEYNIKLGDELQTLRSSFVNYSTHIAYVDIYQPIFDTIKGHRKFGFDEWRRGCCGSGLLESTFLCNRKSYICPNASKYIFWDAIHPTEKTYYILFVALREEVNNLAKN